MSAPKIVVLDNRRFIHDDKTGYYLQSAKSGKARIRLHRYVWEKYNGPIPKGYEIHHIDHDKANNDISNLALLTAEEHRAIHSEELTDERRRQMRENLLATAIPAAAKWHGSEAGREWHKAHYEKMCAAMHKKREIVCAYCGKKYVAERGRFCSGRCKNAWRNKMGLNSCTKNCVICGRPFITRKYGVKQGRTCSPHCTALLTGQIKRMKKCG